MGRVPALIGVLLLAAFVLGSWGFQSPKRCGSPQQAAQRAEAQATPLNLLWGKLRGFSRLPDSWLLVYQPSHGSWVVSVLVPDLGRPEPPGLAVASWLPGARLSASAAQHLARSPTSPISFAERLARRDWYFQASVVFGALPAGSLESPWRGLGVFPWAGSLFLGLLASGALARRIRPHPPLPGLRKPILLACLVMLLGVGGVIKLGGDLFVPGVRPFVTLLVLAAAYALALGVIAASAFLFPIFPNSPDWSILGTGVLLGWLAGLSLSPSWSVTIAGLSPRWLWLLAAPILVAFLLDLAATGVALLVTPLGSLARIVGLGAAAMSLAYGGGWGLLTAASFLASLFPSGQRFWLALGLCLGFLPGAWWLSVGWLGPLRDALILMCGLLGLVLWQIFRAPLERATIRRCV
ncbi:MAG: hypothetical protein ACUVRE_05650 [Thermoanaerobaculaceae bacterium]